MSKKELTPDEQKEVWVKPSGSEITLNCAEATIAKAKELGYKRKNAAKKDDGLDDLRVEYEKVVGKKPHHQTGQEKMEADIAAAKAKAKEGGE